MRNTVKTAIEFEGVGLHGGQTARLEIAPATAGTGIMFQRSDLPADIAVIPARHDRVIDTRLCTRLGNGRGAEVGTVEHVMAALAGLGVSDAILSLDGPEVPIMDGSSAPFVEGLLAAGIVGLGVPRRAMRIRREVAVRRGDKLARLMPAPRFGLSYEIRFEDAAIGTQALSLTMTGRRFVTELADCRTFCRRAEVEWMRAQGLARGGSLENAVVVDGAEVLTPGGLRRPDEFVRHKMLDAVGDLALAGAPIIGHYEGVLAGHEMTRALLDALFAAPDAWEPVWSQPGQLPGVGRPARRPAAAETRVAV